LKQCAQQALAARKRQGHSLSSPLELDDIAVSPYLLGWLAVEAVRQRGVSQSTKVSLVAYTLLQANPLRDGGIPYGLPVLSSFLAARGELDLKSFTTLIKLAEIGRGLFDTIRLDEALALSDWLIAQPGLDDAERLWWLWLLTAHCQPWKVGRPWAEALLAHPALPLELKRELCEAWLSTRPPGPAPADWQAMDRALTGELTESPLDDVDPAEVAALDGPLLDLLPEGDEGDDDAFGFASDPVMPSFTIASHLMRQALGGWVRVPQYLVRRAVLGLAQTSGDPLAVCRRFLAREPDGLHEPAFLGVADIVEAYHAQMPPADVQALVEQGQAMSQSTIRKAFYALAFDLYGSAVLERALSDNAASIRAWAAKKATTDDGRKTKDN
jgi:hypothetical protein